MRVFDPFGDIDARVRSVEALRRELDRLMTDPAAGTAPAAVASFLPGTSARAYPLANLGEDRDNYYVEALAPGIDPGTLSVTVVRNTLTIAGTKAAPQVERADAFHRTERAAGRFNRSIELPVEVDAAKVSAQYADGLLLITLPKSEAARPRQVQVAVG